MTREARWRLSWRDDPGARRLADRHYSRQSVGASGFVPPGRCLVLTLPGTAVWVTSWPYPEYVKHRWAGAWVNSLFRREPGCPRIASELIAEAVAVTRSRWPAIPELGIVSFVDASKVRHKRDPGRCYRKAGWRHVGFTKSGLWAFQQTPDAMPAAAAPYSDQAALFDLAGTRS